MTGGARGIGAAVAKEFAASGAKVASLDVNSPVENRPGIDDFKTDVTNSAAVGSVFTAIVDRLGRIDVLVNNAGIQRVGPTASMNLDTWDMVVATHLRGMFLCSRAVIPVMQSRGEGGAIVSVSSILAHLGLPGRAPYSAAKAGMLGLTRSLAVELAPQLIRVNAVAPGYTRTALTQQGLDDGSLSEDWITRRVPMGRLADPTEIAKTVMYLAGDDASYVTGQCLIVDGGLTIQAFAGRPDWLGEE